MRKSAVAAVGALVLACAVMSGCGSAVIAAGDDATITTRVKTALINDPSVDVARIDVTTSRGVVTLAGRVRSKDEEAKAVGLARSIKGVADVKSTLVIQP